MSSRSWFRIPAAMAIAAVGFVSLPASAQTLSNVGYALSDDAAAAAPVPQTEVSQTLAGCDSSCCESMVSNCCNPCGHGEPTRLIDTCSPWKIGGWAQAGYVTQGRNFDAGDIVWNNRPNQVNAQQNWVFIEREANTGGCGTDWGVRMDYVYGTDAQKVQSFGGNAGSWDTNWDNGAFLTGYGHAIPQLYGTYAINDLTIKGGHFLTPGAYEFIQAPQNFFYSHSASFVFNRPRTLTGVQADYVVNDYVSAFGGWALGFNTGFNDNGGNVGYGGFSLAASDTVDIHYVAYVGDFGHDFGPIAGSDDNGFAQFLTVQKQISCKTRYILQFDHVDNDRYRLLSAGGLGKGFGINNSLIHDINACWGVGARFDWYRDLFGQELKDVTLGLNYRPNANVMIRPEVRWDDFNAGLLQDQTVFGIDAIFQF